MLGPIEAVVVGHLVDLGAPKQRALLALLVSRVGQPVAIDVIVEELWTGHPPPSAITSLQAYVANLRRVLEPDRAPRTPTAVLHTSGRGLAPASATAGEFLLKFPAGDTGCHQQRAKRARAQQRQDNRWGSRAEAARIAEVVGGLGRHAMDRPGWHGP